MSDPEANSQDSYRYDVLLSYHHLQKEWTHKLARRLRDAGFKIWLSEWCLRAGENWLRGLVKGVEESRNIMLVLSPEFLDTQWPVFETYIPEVMKRSAKDSKLIPLLYSHCDLPPELASRQILDFVDTFGDIMRYEFRLEQLMADLDPSRERPKDFNLFCATRDDIPQDAIPMIGQLPVGSLVPFLPNPAFVGRADELKLLYEKIEASEDISLAQTVAITGLCGIGKTQLAVEFVYRYGRRFSGGVFWLDVSDPAGIPDEIACCAGSEGMNLPGSESRSQDELVASVMREWRGSQRRLVVFDGLTNMDVINRWRPASAGTRVLITTRIDASDPRWRDRNVEVCPIGVLSRENSIELLCRGRKDVLSDIGEREAARAISELLGDFPLALNVAGAYLSKYRHEVSLKDYLFDLRSRPILANPALTNPSYDPSPTQHEQNISNMFDSVIDKLDQFNEEEDTDLIAAQLFHLASHFACLPVSRNLLTHALKIEEGGLKNRRKVADALNRLLEMGLIQSLSNGRISMHTLVQEFAYDHPARRQTTNEAAEDVAKAVSNFISKLSQQGQTHRIGEDIEHLKHIARQAERRGSHLTAILYNQIGSYLYETSDLEAAKEYYKRALEIDEAVYGPDHPTVAVRNNNLGMILRELGDLKGAEECYKRALKIDENALGPDHPEIAVIMSNLGRILYELGDLEGAKEQFVKALKIDESVHGTDHPTSARDVSNLGSVLRELGDLEAAKEHFSRALKIDEMIYGSVHPKVANLIANLGKIEHELGDLEGARDYYTRALQIDGEVYGPDHLTVAKDAGDLGLVLREMGDLEGAEKRFRWALNILERRLGTDHPKTQAIRKNLRGLLNARAQESGVE